MNEMNIYTVESSNITAELIKDEFLSDLKSTTSKKDQVASLSNAKKKTYTLVDARMQEYFINAYNTVTNLTTKTAWAEREVIYRTINSEFFNDAFGSQDAYAEEIGVSKSNLSKMKNSVEVRNKVMEITGYDLYSTSLIDELIPSHNKMGDDFARFLQYSQINPTMTVKEIRDSVKHYNSVITGDARPTRSGFFTNTDGTPTETEAEYQERIKNESPDTESNQNSLMTTTSETTSEVPSKESFDVETTDTKKTVKLFLENTKNCTMAWNAKKRGSAPQQVKLEGEVLEKMVELLFQYGVITTK